MQTQWIVIPTYGDVAATDRCLDGLLSFGFVDYGVLVVDHGPEAPVLRALGTRYPSAVFVAASPTLWWTGATNVGIAEVLDRGATSVMLLNCDCVIAPDAVAGLFAEAAREKRIVAPVQRDLVSQRVTASRAWPALVLGFPTLHVSRRLTTRRNVPTSMICGGRGVVIRAEVFDAVGMFAEASLPHYAADHDFYFRCKEAGIPLVIHQEASVYVDSTTTSVAAQTGGLSYADFRESLRNPRSHRNLNALAAFFRRNYPVKRLWRVGYGLAVARYAVIWAIARPLTMAASLGRGWNQGRAPAAETKPRETSDSDTT